MTNMLRARLNRVDNTGRDVNKQKNEKGMLEIKTP